MVKAKAMIDVIHFKEITVTGTVEPLHHVSGLKEDCFLEAAAQKWKNWVLFENERGLPLRCPHAPDWLFYWDVGYIVPVPGVTALWRMETYCFLTSNCNKKKKEGSEYHVITWKFHSILWKRHVFAWNYDYFVSVRGSVSCNYVKSFMFLLDNFHMTSPERMGTKCNEANKGTALERLFRCLQLNWHVSHRAPADSPLAQNVDSPLGRFTLTMVQPHSFQNPPQSAHTNVNVLCVISFRCNSLSWNNGKIIKLIT